MNYDYKEKKIVIVLDSKLEMGVALNVVGHLSMALGYHAENHMGRKNLSDASNGLHLGISRYPIIITKAKGGKLRNGLLKAKASSNVLVVDYPSIMYETEHDDELADALSSLSEDSIEYYGFIMYGKTEEVDGISGKFSLWR